MKIVTQYSVKPIPVRDMDWAAWDDETYDADCENGNWVGGAIGHGPTEQAAIDDLKEQLEMLR
jgi:hypothetical protein